MKKTCNVILKLQQEERSCGKHKIGGYENAICAAGGFYCDTIALMIFKKYGGKAWADFVYNHYDPNAGVVQIVIDD